MFKKHLFLVLLALGCTQATFAQTITPSVIATAGGYTVNGGVSLSYTVGEPAFTTLQNGSLVLTQGEQQPYITLKILNLKAYLQGFYLGGGQMQAVLSSFDPLLPGNSCDSITVELHNALAPYALAATKKAMLLTNGTATVQFPATLGNNSYYIVLLHRNSLQTWSKTPVNFSATTVTYDFSTP